MQRFGGNESAYKNEMMKEYNMNVGKVICNIKKDFLIDNVIKNHNYIKVAQKARKWIKRNTVQGKGIVITNKQRKIYQEVTGYYIPTLMQWGMRDEAIAYSAYLCGIQEKDGSWLDYTQTRSSVFNTGQVLRGLYEVADIYPNAYEHLIRGCDWLISNVKEDGRLAATEGTSWSDGFNSELIHLYCLPPLLYTGKKYGRTDYVEAVHKVKKYYIREYKQDIENFNYLSHFYAYIMEALVDIGEIDIVKNAMSKVEKLQKVDGAVPAFKSCDWVCSTGLFQFAIVWFKLGDWKHGNKAFDYATSLQNETGGWYGGYPASLRFLGNKRVPYSITEEISYFPNEEISWAVKYFFDALHYREKLEFELKAHTFIDYIDSSDSKYQSVYAELKKLADKKDFLRIADIGCGKGRYLKKLILDFPNNEYHGLDLSETVFKYSKNPKIKLSVGNILKTNYDNESFDMVFAVESIERAVFVDLAINEMCRITKSGGSVVIIDKVDKAFDDFKYSEWIYPEELSTKQWLNEKNICQIFNDNGISDVEIIDVPIPEGELYKAFIGRK